MVQEVTETRRQTNAEKIAAWREANPTRRITGSILCEILDLPNLRNADLRNANLRNADLWGANLRNADLWGADLWGADLRNANLRNADLRGANLRNADLWGGMPIQAGGSGSGALVPTPAGWRLTIGCWRNKTLGDLLDLIEDRREWPEANGDERERRRPMLRAVLALCEAHIAQQPADIIESLAEKWGSE